MRVKSFRDSKHMSMTDQIGRTTSKSPDRLVRVVDRFVKSVIETKSKVYELLTYNEEVNNLIYKSRL